MKNVFLLLMASLALGGCLDDDDSASSPGGGVGVGASPIDIPFSQEYEITSIDRNEGILHTRAERLECVDGEAISDFELSQIAYSIQGGVLSLVDEYSECAVEQYSGTSTDVVGNWSGGARVLVEGAPSYCAEEEEDTADFGDLRVSITENKLTNSGVVRNYCVADDFARNGFVKQDCATLILEHEGATITMKINSVSGTNGYAVSATLTNAQGERCQADIREQTTAADCAAGIEPRYAARLCAAQLLGLTQE